MTGARGIVVAAAVAIVLTGAHASYRVWPVTRGTEICVAAALFRQPAPVGVVLVRLPMARIELDVPHTAPAVTEPFEPVRRVGGWWIAGGDARANARARRGRQLYLQLEPGTPVMAGGPVQARPVTASDSPVDGAINVAGRVDRVREDGYLWLDFAIGWIGVPADVEAGARPLWRPPAEDGRGPIPAAADPGVFAVLRVLPSGRLALTGVIVNGARY